jgi:ElaB/YqjD/DUF883 family membrane-anchored ribosome-binding protein
MDEKLDSRPHEAGGRASHLADEMKQKGRELLDKVEEGAKDFKVKHIDDIAQDVGDFVKKHPGTLILASFVVGVALGAILRGGNKSNDG